MFWRAENASRANSGLRPPGKCGVPSCKNQCPPVIVAVLAHKVRVHSFFAKTKVIMPDNGDAVVGVVCAPDEIGIEGQLSKGCPRGNPTGPITSVSLHTQRTSRHQRARPGNHLLLTPTAKHHGICMGRGGPPASRRSAGPGSRSLDLKSPQNWGASAALGRHFQQRGNARQRRSLSGMHTLHPPHEAARKWGGGGW